VCPPKLCPELFGILSRETRETGWESPRGPALTRQQRRVVDLVAEGLTNKEVASHLNLSEFTVRNHLDRIMELLEVGSRTELIDRVLPVDSNF